MKKLSTKTGTFELKSARIKDFHESNPRVAKLKIEKRLLEKHKYKYLYHAERKELRGPQTRKVFDYE